MSEIRRTHKILCWTGFKQRWPEIQRTLGVKRKATARKAADDVEVASVLRLLKKSTERLAELDRKKVAKNKRELQDAINEFLRTLNRKLGVSPSRRKTNPLTKRSVSNPETAVA